MRLAGKEAERTKGTENRPIAPTSGCCQSQSFPLPPASSPGPGPNLTKQTHRMQAPLPHRFICTDKIHSTPREGDQQKKRESVSGNFQQGYEFLQTPATEA